MASLIDFEAPRHHAKHLIVGEIRVVTPVLREVARVVSDELKTGAIGVKNLATAGRVLHT